MRHWCAALAFAALPALAGAGEKTKPEEQGRVTRHWMYDLAAERLGK